MKYAGIGSRETPTDVLEKMHTIGQQCAEAGWLLRSGGAHGADTAFEIGCDKVNGEKQIFLPKRMHNGNTSPYYDCPDEAFRLLDDLFPEAKNRLPYVRALLARNMQQVFGPNLDDPTDLIICWMKKKTPSGGTGWAVRAAQKFGIPVINLLHEEHLVHLFF